MARPQGLLLAGVSLLLSAVGSAPDHSKTTQEYKPTDDYMPTEERLPFFPEMKDGKCFFPFTYKGGVFYDCVKFKAKHKWCSLTQTYAGYWKYCSEEDLAKCSFPFWFRRLIYWDCTDDAETFGKKWCSLTENYNKEKVWKYCDEVYWTI